MTASIGASDVIRMTMAESGADTKYSSVNAFPFLL